MSLKGMQYGWKWSGGTLSEKDKTELEHWFDLNNYIQRLSWYIDKSGWVEYEYKEIKRNKEKDAQNFVASMPLPKSITDMTVFMIALKQDIDHGYMCKLGTEYDICRCSDAAFINKVRAVVKMARMIENDNFEFKNALDSLIATYNE